MKRDFTNTLIYFSKCMFLLSLYCPNDEKDTIWLEGMTGSAWSTEVGLTSVGGAAALLTWDVAFSHSRTLVSGRWLSQTVFKVYRKCIRFIL